MSVLAISDLPSTLSLIGQLVAIGAAILIGRTVIKSRGAIWLVALAGALGAFISHVLVDGQGALLLVFYVPVIYLVSVAGRRDLA